MDPPTALAEWIDAIRLVLTGERVSYQGTTVAFEDAELGWKPLRRHVPLWIAATSATGLRLAGRIGDGVLLNTVASPEYSANAVRIVRQAAQEAGRDQASFEVAQLINTSVEEDHGAALDAVRWEVATAAAGIKYLDRTDVLLVLLAPGTTVAGVFTLNRFCAAPVQLCRKHLAANVGTRARTRSVASITACFT